MAGIVNFAEEQTNNLIKQKINDLKFDEVFKSQIVPKLEAAIEAGVEKLFESAAFQQKTAEVFYADLFKIYDAALRDCAAVQKIIDDTNADTNAAFGVFIEKIQDSGKDDTKIKEAKTDFLGKMTVINTKNGGASMKKIQDLKDSFTKQADKISSPAVSPADQVEETNLFAVLTKLHNKTQEESGELENRMEELINSQEKLGGKSRKTKGGKSKKRKRTYKRR